MSAVRRIPAALRFIATGKNPGIANLQRHLDAHAEHVLAKYADRFADGYEAGQNDTFDSLSAGLPDLVEQKLTARGLVGMTAGHDGHTQPGTPRFELIQGGAS